MTITVSGGAGSGVIVIVGCGGNRGGGSVDGVVLVVVCAGTVVGT